jgi:hypothetical protein
MAGVTPALAFFICFPLSFALPNSLFVRAAGMACVVENIDDYTQAQGEDFIVAILDRCPEPEFTSEAIESLAVGMDPTPVARSSSESVQRIISLNAAEIRCLRDSRNDALRELGRHEVVELHSFLGTVC